MKKIGILCLTMIVLLALGSAAQHRYAFYYDLTEERDLEITVINPMFDDATFVMTIYDAYGTRMWADSDTLNSAASGFVLVGDVVPDTDAPWGLVTVDSTQPLIFGLEYLMDGELISVDSIVHEVPQLPSDELFFLGAYFSQAGESRTVAVVMNPWPESTLCAVDVYNSDGDHLYRRELLLSPYEAELINLTPLVGTGRMIWGFIDITMKDRAVVLAMEYYNRGCTKLFVDNVTDYYY